MYVIPPSVSRVEKRKEKGADGRSLLKSSCSRDMERNVIGGHLVLSCLNV
jgi:hypothetical protein